MIVEKKRSPPYTIDPQVLRRFDQRQTVFGRRMFDPAAPFYGQGVHDNAAGMIARGAPGYGRLEYARLLAAWTVYDHFQGAFSWQKLGQPDPAIVQLGRYAVADPAHMSALVKETARIYGASLAGVCELDRRWVYAHDMDGQPVEIPPAFRYAIVMAIAMDTAAIQDSPTFVAGTATGVGYSHMAFAIACLAEFIRHLGYQAMPMGNDTALSIPLAIDAGLGELGRNGLLITPGYGPCVRLCKILTDLPLEPDPPIQFGVAETCARCTRCAEACEAGAIQSDPEPSFRVVCPSNNQGVRRWAVNHDRCYAFWVQNGASCSTCIAACPFTQHATRTTNNTNNTNHTQHATRTTNNTNNTNHTQHATRTTNNTNNTNHTQHATRPQGRRQVTAERPNVLLIHSDQHRFDCLGANGHPLLETPHLDRLAAEGMNFTHAFCPIPVCVPSRNSLLFGQWPTGHLAIANWDTEAPRPAREGLPAWSQVLRDAGYWLGYAGKWQVHPQKSPLAYGFHRYVPDAEYAAWREARGLPPRPRTNRWFGEVDPHIGPQDARLAWGADQAIQLLQQAAAQGQPFFVRWDPDEPHIPNVVPEPYFSLYPPEAIPPWPSYPDPLQDKPYIQAQQRRTWGVDRWTWADWAGVVSRYLGEIALLDAQVGRLLDTLQRLGVAENTLVVYTTDHGDLCGGHGMIDKHFVMYDDVTRVPLLMRWPARIAPGSVCDAFVSHSIDLAATFCQVAGAPVPETFEGQSLLLLMCGQGTNVRQDILSMYHGNQFGLYSQRMLRDRRWKYVWNATAEDELYDLQADPGELHNLAAGPAHRDGRTSLELARLRRRLVDWMEAIADPLLNVWARAQLLQGLK